MLNRQQCMNWIKDKMSLWKKRV